MIPVSAIICAVIIAIAAFDAYLTHDENDQ